MRAPFGNRLPDSEGGGTAGPSVTANPPAIWFVLAGLAMGLTYGLLEAVAAQVLSHWGGSLSWKNGTSIKALLYSPIVYSFAFLVLSLPFLLLSRFLRRVAWDAVLFWFLVALSGFLLARLMGHWFSPFAAIMIGLGAGTVAGRWYLAQRDRRSRLLRRVAPALICSLLLVGLLGQVWQRVQENRTLAHLTVPARNAANVLLLVLDTERGDHLTPYGYARPTTPVLARLAREGVVFEWAISPAPTTLPSHSSMLTGRRVVEHRAGTGGRRYLDTRYPTIAEVLRDNGYATAGFVANIFWAGRQTGLNRGFVHYEDFYGTTLDRIGRTILGRDLAYFLLPRLGYVDIPGRKSAEVVNRELLAWLAAAPAGRSFFAMVNYMDVHAPYLPPKGYRGRISPPHYRTNRIEIGAWNEHDHLPPPSVLQEWRDRYDESLMYLDHEIGRLLDSLRARGRLENTLVIVTADHGESFGEHGTVHHGGSLHLEQIHVPLLVWGPDVLTGPKRVVAPVDLRSVPATIVDAARLNRNPFPGKSLFHYLDSIPDSLTPALSEGPEVKSNPDAWQTGKGWVTSIVDGRWHLIALESGEFEVYDVLTDRGETRNLASAPEGQRQIQRLREELRKVLPDNAGLKDVAAADQD
jgi:arylsulfatase A-like enzyme